ncbi:MAG TPA: phosphoglycolate phosphatase [Conexivisphaerales archaeon]|nr:phosphoglycolate phosphatase [Conexivisphaerales archaeon]
MKVSAFAVDVDGTLTAEEGGIDLEAASVLANLERMGYPVILVSGRSGWELLELSINLCLSRVVVGENGGVSVYKSPLRIRLWSDNTQPVLAYEYLSQRVKGLVLRDTFPRFTEVVLERTMEVGVLREALEGSGLNVKVLDSGYAFHITSGKVDKSVGLSKVLEEMRIRPEEVVAIGDSETDVPMFKMVGYSICVGNGDVAARAACKHIVKGRQGSGVIEAVAFSLGTLISGSRLKKQDKR